MSRKPNTIDWELCPAGTLALLNALRAELKAMVKRFERTRREKRSVRARRFK